MRAFAAEVIVASAGLLESVYEKCLKHERWKNEIKTAENSEDAESK